MRIRSRSPGKLILSGEHAVVHGRPALAMAVSAAVDVVSDPLKAPHLCIHLPDRTPVEYPLNVLPELLMELRLRHQQFKQGILSISEVVDSPEQLLAATAAMASPQSGAHLRFHSQLPLGSGLGSSAACILALLKVLQPALDTDRLFNAAVEAESFQHGRSSGLDVAASLHGGLILFCNTRFDSVSLGTPLPPFRVYNSGRPDSGTGECVSAVAQAFPVSDPVWSEFEEITKHTLAAVQAGNGKTWHDCVRENHRLLCRIGVVPPIIQTHIAALERSGCAAKICGAGSVRGDSAGMILVCGDAPPSVPSEWREMHFTLSEQGTTLIPETA